MKTIKTKKKLFRKLNNAEFEIHPGKYGYDPGIIYVEGVSFHARKKYFNKRLQQNFRIYYCHMNRETGCKVSIREVIDSKPEVYYISQIKHAHDSKTEQQTKRTSRSSVNVTTPIPFSNGSQNNQNITFIEFQEPHNLYAVPCSEITFKVTRHLLFAFFQTNSSYVPLLFLRDRSGKTTSVEILERNTNNQNSQLTFLVHLGKVERLNGSVNLYCSFFLFGDNLQYVYTPIGENVFVATHENNRNENPGNHLESESQSRSLLKKRKLNEGLENKLYCCYPERGPMEGRQLVSVFFDISSVDYFNRLLNNQNIITNCMFGELNAEVAERVELCESVMFRIRDSITDERKLFELEGARFSLTVKTPNYRSTRKGEVMGRIVVDVSLTFGRKFAMAKERCYEFYDVQEDQNEQVNVSKYVAEEEEEDGDFGMYEDLFNDEALIYGNQNAYGDEEDDLDVFGGDSVFTKFGFEDTPNLDKLQDVFGANILFYAVAQNQIDMVESILEEKYKNRFDLYHEDVLGYTIFDVALRFDHIQMYQTLLRIKKKKVEEEDKKWSEIKLLEEEAEVSDEGGSSEYYLMEVHDDDDCVLIEEYSEGEDEESVRENGEEENVKNKIDDNIADAVIGKILHSSTFETTPWRPFEENITAPINCLGVSKPLNVKLKDSSNSFESKLHLSRGKRQYNIRIIPKKGSSAFVKPSEFIDLRKLKTMKSIDDQTDKPLSLYFDLQNRLNCQIDIKFKFRQHGEHFMKFFECFLSMNGINGIDSRDRIENMKKVKVKYEFSENIPRSVRGGDIRKWSPEITSSSSDNFSNIISLGKFERILELSKGWGDSYLPFFKKPPSFWKPLQILNLFQEIPVQPTSTNYRREDDHHTRKKRALEKIKSFYSHLRDIDCFESFFEEYLCGYFRNPKNRENNITGRLDSNKLRKDARNIFDQVMSDLKDFDEKGEDVSPSLKYVLEKKPSLKPMIRDIFKKFQNDEKFVMPRHKVLVKRIKQIQSANLSHRDALNVDLRMVEEDLDLNHKYWWDVVACVDHILSLLLLKKPFHVHVLEKHVQFKEFERKVMEKSLVDRSGMGMVKWEDGPARFLLLDDQKWRSALNKFNEKIGFRLEKVCFEVYFECELNKLRKVFREKFIGPLRRSLKNGEYFNEDVIHLKKELTKKRKELRRFERMMRIMKKRMVRVLSNDDGKSSEEDKNVVIEVERVKKDIRRMEERCNRIRAKIDFLNRHYVKQVDDCREEFLKPSEGEKEMEKEIFEEYISHLVTNGRRKRVSRRRLKKMDEKRKVFLKGRSEYISKYLRELLRKECENGRIREFPVHTVYSVNKNVRVEVEEVEGEEEGDDDDDDEEEDDDEWERRRNSNQSGSVNDFILPPELYNWNGVVVQHSVRIGSLSMIWMSDGLVMISSVDNEEHQRNFEDVFVINQKCALIANDSKTFEYKLYLISQEIVNACVNLKYSNSHNVSSSSSNGKNTNNSVHMISDFPNDVCSYGDFGRMILWKLRGKPSVPELFQVVKTHEEELRNRVLPAFGKSIFDETKKKKKKKRKKKKRESCSSENPYLGVIESMRFLNLKKVNNGFKKKFAKVLNRKVFRTEWNKNNKSCEKKCVANFKVHKKTWVYFRVASSDVEIFLEECKLIDEDFEMNYPGVVQLLMGFLKESDFEKVLDTLERQREKNRVEFL